ncbi:Host cell factor 2 [Balamuthia mandrillaris]
MERQKEADASRLHPARGSELKLKTLHEAAVRGDEALLRELLEGGVLAAQRYEEERCDKRRSNRGSPSRSTLASSLERIENATKQKKSNTNPKDAAAREDGKGRVLGGETLYSLMMGVDLFGRTALHKASWFGHVRCVRLLLEYAGQYLRFVGEKEKEVGEAPNDKAEDSDEDARLRVENLEGTDRVIQLRDIHGFHCLLFAITANQLEVVRLLLPLYPKHLSWDTIYRYHTLYNIVFPWREEELRMDKYTPATLIVPASLDPVYHSIDKLEIFNWSYTLYTSWATKGVAAAAIGKWYFEVKLIWCPCRVLVGWARKDIFQSEQRSLPQYFTFDATYCRHWDPLTSGYYGEPCSDGDVIGCELDKDNGTVSFYRNGCALGIYTDHVPDCEMIPIATVSSMSRVRFNFGTQGKKWHNNGGLGTENESEDSIDDDRARWWYPPPSNAQPVRGRYTCPLKRAILSRKLQEYYYTFYHDLASPPSACVLLNSAVITNAVATASPPILELLLLEDSERARQYLSSSDNIELLRVAAGCNNRDVLRWLLNIMIATGSKNNSSSKQKQTPMKELLGKSLRNSLNRSDEHGTALWHATANANVECAQMLVEAGANISILSPVSTRAETLLHTAASVGSIPLVKLFLIAATTTTNNLTRRTPIEARDKRHGFTPLLSAITAAHFNVVWYLLFGEEEPEEAATQREALVAALRQNFISEEHFSRWSSFMTQHIHAANERSNTVSPSSSFLKANVHVRAYDGSTVLHAAAGGSPDMMFLLLQCGAKAEVRNKNLESPLDAVASCADYLLIKVLLRAGASADPPPGILNASTMQIRMTPLGHALQCNKHTVRLLLEAGANVNQVTSTGQNAIHVATTAGNVEALKLLSEHCFLYKRNILGKRIYCSRRPTTPTDEYLTIDIDQRTPDMMLPLLCFACGAPRNAIETVSYLLDLGCTCTNPSIFFIAAMASNTALLRFLLTEAKKEWNLDFNCLTDGTVMRLALQERNEHILLLLMEHGYPLADVGRNRLSTVWVSLGSDALLDPRPLSRYGHTATLTFSFGEAPTLVALGGCVGRELQDFIHTFDCTNRSWAVYDQNGCETLRRFYHSATLVGDSVFVFGGLYFASQGAPLQTLNDMVVISLSNLQGLQWDFPTTIGSPPSPRSQHQAVLIGTKLFIIGGLSEARNVLNDVYWLDIDTFEWHRVTFSSSASSSSTSSPEKEENEKEILFPGRSSHTAIAVEERGQIWIWGGYTSFNEDDNWYVLEVDEMRWNKVNAIGEEISEEEVKSGKRRKPLPRAAHSAVLVGKEIYIYGGKDVTTAANTELGDLWAFNIETHRWKEIRLASSEIVNSSHTCNFLPPNLLMIYGGNVPANHNVFCIPLDLPDDKVKFTNLIEDPSADICFVFENENGEQDTRTLPGHRCILSLHSSYFEDLFSYCYFPQKTCYPLDLPNDLLSHCLEQTEEAEGSNKGKEKSSQLSVLPVADKTKRKLSNAAVQKVVVDTKVACYEVFAALLEFLYTGEIHLENYKDQLPADYAATRPVPSFIKELVSAVEFYAPERKVELVDTLFKVPNFARPILYSGSMEYHLNNIEFSDLRLIGDNGQGLYIHKVMLHYCPYFQALLRMHSFSSSSSSSSIPELPVEDFNFDLCQLVQIVYMRDSNYAVRSRNVMTFFLMAEKYGNSMLKLRSEECMIRNLEEESLIPLFSLAEMCSAPRLKNYCEWFLHRHYDSLLRSSGQQLVELLSEETRERAHNRQKERQRKKWEVTRHYGREAEECFWDGVLNNGMGMARGEVKKGWQQMIAAAGLCGATLWWMFGRDPQAALLD